MHSQRGLTLLEVLTSIILLSIIVLTILTLFTQAATYTSRNEKKTVAISVAQGILHYLQQENFVKIYTYVQTTPIWDVQNNAINEQNFDNPTLLTEILQNTTINDVSFKNKIHIYFVNYTNNVTFTNTLQTLPEPVKTIITQKSTLLKNTPPSLYQLHCYVQVNWDTSATPIVLEGTIEHETLRHQ